MSDFYYENEINRLARRRRLAMFFTLVIMVILPVAIFLVDKVGKLAAVSETSGGSEKPLPMNPFSTISLEAKAAYVYDVHFNKVLFSLNPNEQLPLASLAKLMTAVVALDYAPEYTTITIGGDAIAQEGDTGLRSEEKWNLKDLLKLTLMASSNDGAHAIATALQAINPSISDEITTTTEPFINQMNEKARTLGLTQTYFLNETGLDVDITKSGAYGTVSDISNLFAYVLQKYPDLIAVTKESKFQIASLDGKIHTVKNTDSLVDKIPGILGSKTGFTDLAGGNLVVAYDASIGRPIVIALLGSSREGRFEDMEKLVQASLDFLPLEDELLP